MSSAQSAVLFGGSRGREGWDHPINQPLGNLLAHNAVLQVRVPPGGHRLDAQTWSLAHKAEELLETTDRARFLYAWPTPQEASMQPDVAPAARFEPSTLDHVSGDLNRGGVQQPEPPGPGWVFGTVEGSDRYHYQSCREFARTMPQKRVWFKDAEASRAAGREPCLWCGPCPARLAGSSTGSAPKAPQKPRNRMKQGLVALAAPVLYSAMDRNRNICYTPPWSHTDRER